MNYSEENNAKVYKVYEITREIRRILEFSFGAVYVIGEISNLKIPKSGHIYFSLKDKYSQIKVVKFYGKNIPSFSRLKDGDMVKIYGNITVYEKTGEYQIQAISVESIGKGELRIKYFELLEKLKKEGLFDEKYKKKIPLLPKKIAIVTSPTGAAIRDMLNVLSRRFGNVHIVIFPVKVQGDGAAEEIAEAIEILNKYNEADVIIVGRGGGSLEDLWAFNEEIVARAIFNSKIPIISAVGHQVDFTISDYVADLRAETPTAAAEIVLKNKTDFINAINISRQTMIKHMRNLIEKCRYKLKMYVDHYVFNIPQRILMQYAQTIDDSVMRMENVMNEILKERKSRLNICLSSYYIRNPEKFFYAQKQEIEKIIQNLEKKAIDVLKEKKVRLDKAKEKLRILCPLSILSRGYSITRGVKTGKIITTKKQAEKEKEFETILFKGKIISVLKSAGD